VDREARSFGFQRASSPLPPHQKDFRNGSEAAAGNLIGVEGNADEEDTR
jgi:hypothetical protein